MKTRDILLIGGLGALALWYLKKQAIDAGSAIINLPSTVGEGIANALYDWINPSMGVEEVFYTVTFPSGVRHAISSRVVDSAGNFEYDGIRYLMKRNAAGQNVAVYS